MPEQTPEQLGREASESAALRNLRTSLRVAAEDLYDLDKRIKYRVTPEDEAFTEAHLLAVTLLGDVAHYEAERP